MEQQVDVNLQHVEEMIKDANWHFDYHTKKVAFFKVQLDVLTQMKSKL